MFAYIYSLEYIALSTQQPYISAHPSRIYIKLKHWTLEEKQRENEGSHLNVRPVREV